MDGRWRGALAATAGVAVGAMITACLEERGSGALGSSTVGGEAAVLVKIEAMFPLAIAIFVPLASSPSRPPHTPPFLGLCPSRSPRKPQCLNLGPSRPPRKPLILDLCPYPRRFRAPAHAVERALLAAVIRVRRDGLVVQQLHGTERYAQPADAVVAILSPEH